MAVDPGRGGGMMGPGLEMVRFDPLGERWTLWELPDGMRLGIRSTALGLSSKAMEGDKGRLQLPSRRDITTWAPESMRGPPTGEGRTPKVVEEYDLNDLKSIQRGASTYLVDDGFVLCLSPVLKRLRRLDTYDQNGVPVLRVTASDDATTIPLQAPLSPRPAEP